MLAGLGALVKQHSRLVIVAWLALAVSLHLVAPRWNDVIRDGDLAYLPGAMPSVRGVQLLSEAFPSERGRSEVAVIVERSGNRLTPHDLVWSDSLAEKFRAAPERLSIADVWNRNTDVVGDKLISRVSKQGQATVTLLKIQNEFMATANMNVLNGVLAIINQAKADVPAGLNVGITGSAAIGGDMLSAASESIRSTEWATLLLVVIILLVVYRAPLMVLVPLVTIGVSLVISLDTLAILTQLKGIQGFDWWRFKVFATTRIFIVVILFGAGTDFCLFLIARYREELAHGLAPRAAVAESVGQVGEALIGSALTTICGLAMMFFADFGKFASSGPAIAICLAITLAASLSLAPSLLVMGGKAVFWPFAMPVAATSKEYSGRLQEKSRLMPGDQFWNWAAGAILQRPGPILIATLVLLAPFAIRGLSVDMTYDFLGELSATRPSVQGTNIARRHFTPGEMAPVTLLVYKPNGSFDEKEGERQIARLTKALYDMPGIESVRSLTEPTGDPPGYFQPFRKSGLKKIAAREHKITKARFLTPVKSIAGEVARFDLVFHGEPFSDETIARLNELEAWLDAQSCDDNSAWYGAEFAFIGTTVGVRDLELVTTSDTRLIQQLVVLVVLGVLFALLRRPLICIYLIATVLFSYLVTIGATQWFFSWLYGSTYHGLDWKVPIFLFVILIAVGQDYNIYLVTRVFEEQQRLGASAGLRRALATTGGIITSCGVIMAGTFISMTTGSLRGMSELGFALSLGILIDTCIVRPILVPTFLALVQRKEIRDERRAPSEPATKLPSPQPAERVGSRR
jgi:RND superfamily putative drug exporter